MEKQLTNYSAGLDSIAEIYLEKRIDNDHETELIYVFNDLNPVPLYRYKLIDGTFAEEYLQYFAESEHEQIIYFLGLKTEKRFFRWPAEKIIKKLKKKI